MKTVSNPIELDWRNDPVPSASVVHPDCRIIGLHIFGEKWIETFILAPSNSGNSWADPNGRLYIPGQYQSPIFSWAWYKRF